MMQIQQQPFTVSARDKHLPGSLWFPEQGVRAVVLLVHGLGEHHGRYTELVETFAAEGFAIAGFDLPGHGQAAGKRGHFLLDEAIQFIGSALDHLARHFPNAPLILYGHSMGGNLAAAYVRQVSPSVPNLRGLILSSPWLELAFSPPRPLLWLAGLMARLVPAYCQPNRIDPGLLSRDSEVGKAYLNDPLVHQQISAGLYCACADSGKASLSSPECFRLPVLVMHGTDDKITSAEASRRFAERLPQATFKAWQGLRHEPHHEPDKAAVFAYVIQWIEDRLQFSAGASFSAYLA